ncbi:glycosyltransferase, partial [bacterium]|nr:glycosyltransferase [bacterium]
MRVAYLSTNPSIDLEKPGGPRAHILGTIQGMEGNGLEVQRFFASDFISNPPRVSQPNTKATLAPARRSKLRLILSDLKRLVQCWSLDDEVEKALDAYQPDVIYERSWLFSFAGVRYAKKHQIPLFLETSGCEAEITATAYGISNVWLANTLDAFKFRFGYAVVTQSVNSIESTKRKFRVRVPVIAKPIGFEASTETSVEAYPNNELIEFKKRFSIIVGFVGTFGVYQGPDFLMQVIEAMDSQHKEIGFLLIGGGGKQHECVQFAEKKQLKNV